MYLSFGRFGKAMDKFSSETKQNDNTNCECEATFFAGAFVCSRSGHGPRCLNVGRVCDGKEDCDGGEDEAGCDRGSRSDAG